MKNRPEQVPEITEMVKRALVFEVRTCAGHNSLDLPVNLKNKGG